MLWHHIALVCHGNITSLKGTQTDSHFPVFLHSGVKKEGSSKDGTSIDGSCK
jgi:hypothetical protein